MCIQTFAENYPFFPKNSRSLSDRFWNLTVRVIAQWKKLQKSYIIQCMYKKNVFYMSGHLPCRCYTCMCLWDVVRCLYIVNKWADLSCYFICVAVTHQRAYHACFEFQWSWGKLNRITRKASLLEGSTSTSYTDRYTSLLREASSWSLAWALSGSLLSLNLITSTVIPVQTCLYWHPMTPLSSTDKPVCNPCAYAELQALSEAGHLTSESLCFDPPIL